MKNINNLIQHIRDSICRTLTLEQEMSDEELREKIIEMVFNISKDKYITLQEKKLVVDTVFNSMRGLDILQPMIDDEDVTEVMINGPDNIFIEKNGKVSKQDIRFETEDKLESLIQSVVSRVNRTVNEAAPIVDARLLDGSRVNVVLKPVALNGPVMTIRKFGSKFLTMEKMIEFGTVSKEAAGFLSTLVKAKYNIFICGGTSSGKTTFLNALAGYISKDERIITIEDSAELRIEGIENIVSMETRNANVEGKGSISIRELIRTSLRMRPERIIVGEVRGAEALDMLQAMNTGHDGSLSTGHGNSAKDMMSRLETMVLLGANLPLDAIRRQIASAIDIIVHISRMGDGSRKVLEISEIDGIIDGQINLNPVFYFHEGKLIKTGSEFKNRAKFIMAGKGGYIDGL